MKNLGLLSDLSRRLSSLKRDERGVSAVEFAMLLPLMITLYLGAVEISQGVSINRKVTLTSRTVADLASQVSSISSSDMTNLLNASAAVIAPFPAGQLKVTVSQVIDRSEQRRQGKLERHAQRHQARSRLDGDAADGAQGRQYQLIWSEVSYNYVPTIGYVVTGALNLQDQIYMRPRLSDTVTGPSTC